MRRPKRPKRQIVFEGVEGEFLAAFTGKTKREATDKLHEFVSRIFDEFVGAPVVIQADGGTAVVFPVIDRGDDPGVHWNYLLDGKNSWTGHSSFQGALNAARAHLFSRLVDKEMGFMLDERHRMTTMGPKEIKAEVSFWATVVRRALGRMDLCLDEVDPSWAREIVSYYAWQHQYVVEELRGAANPHQAASHADLTATIQELKEIINAAP